MTSCISHIAQRIVTTGNKLDGCDRKRWEKNLKWCFRNLTEGSGKDGSEPQRLLVASHPKPETRP
jgi:hypothetical protein